MRDEASDDFPRLFHDASEFSTDCTLGMSCAGIYR